jgi:hypothetical protein
MLLIADISKSEPSDTDLLYLYSKSAYFAYIELIVEFSLYMASLIGLTFASLA